MTLGRQGAPLIRRALALSASAAVALALITVQPVAAATWNPYPQTTTTDQGMTYQVNPSHSGSPGTQTMAPPLQPAWTLNLGGPVSYPLVAPEGIFVTATNPTTNHAQLFAINYRTGAIAWGPVDLGGSFWANASYDNGRVFTINSTGQMQAFDAQSGASQWATQLPGQTSFTSPPSGSIFGSNSDLVYTSGAGSGGTLYALHEGTGAIAWQASVMNGDHSTPVVTNSGVYVSYACAQTYDFEPLTGALLWHHAPGCEGGGGKTAVLYNGKLYVRDAAVGNTVFDAGTGATLGTFNASVAPAFSGSTGFFLNGSTLQAVDLGTNASLWSFTGDASLSTAPIVVNGTVYVGSTLGNIFGIDASTGKQTWSAAVGAPIKAPDEQNASAPLAGLGTGGGYLAVPAGDTLTLFGSALGIAPGSVNFGVKSLGSSTTVPVLISDNFAGPVTISSVAASGDYTASSSCGPLNDGGGCQVLVTFTPSAYGSRNGTLTINDTTPGSPHSVALIGGATPGPVDHLVLTPPGATMAAGGTQAYGAEAYDAYGQDGGDYTNHVTFSISQGTCTANVCTSTKAGSQQVTGQAAAAFGTATLNVTAAAADHIALSPSSWTIRAGDPEPYSVLYFDQYGNQTNYMVQLGAAYSISPEGSCALGSCTATVVGPHTVTALSIGLTATGTLNVTPGRAARLAITPASATITAGGAASFAASAFDQYGNSVGDVTASTNFSVAPDGSCTYASCGATRTGTHTVSGTASGPSGPGPTGTASLTVTAGAFDHTALTPATAAVAAGTPQAFNMEGSDQYGNDLGPAGAATTLSITPDGSCVVGSCSATKVGLHTVTASASGATSTASLTVSAAPTATIHLNPRMQTTAAGIGQAYALYGDDQYFNATFSNITNGFGLTIGPPTTACAGNLCSATTPGVYTVTATYLGLTTTTQQTVTVGPLDHLVLTPATATIIAGGSQTYAVEGFDQYGNDLGGQTTTSAFTITPDGWCTGATCTASLPGSHTVTAADGGKSATATLSVTPATVDHIAMSPSTATITAGGSQAYAAEAFDQYGNDLGPAAGTGYSIAPDGLCNGATCTATVAGTHTVTANSSGKTATASLTVNASGLDHIRLTPATTSITAGGSMAYSIEGFDTYSNDLGPFTANSSMSIAPDGSCTNAACTATRAGAHTVTATSQGKTATASLTVNAGPTSALAVSPTSVTLAVGKTAALSASATDAYGNAVSSGAATWSLSTGTPGTLSAATGSGTTFVASTASAGTGTVTAHLGTLTARTSVRVVPAAPTGLSATAQAGRKITLTWKAAAGDKTFALYRSAGSGAWTLIKAGLTTTTFADSDLTSGTTYRYYVTGRAAGLESAASNQVTVAAR